MKRISRKQLEELRKVYHPGRRVMLIEMDDDQAPPVGTEGTVTGVDDLGGIMVDWDNGCDLSVIWDVDYATVLPPYTIRLSGDENIFDSQEDAEAFLQILIDNIPERSPLYRCMLVKVRMGYDNISELDGLDFLN